jgi:5'-3' exonuclease
MVGDTSDNIKGVAGYGAKRSKTFVENFEQDKYKLSPSDIDIIKRNRQLMNVKKGFIWQNNEKAFLDKQLEEFEQKEDQHEFRVLLRTHELEDHWQILKKSELSTIDIADVVDNIMMEL